MTPPRPPSDDVNRDAFYSSDAIEPDDADYEIEPVDPDVLTAEQRLANERIAAAARSIDQDELLREDTRRLDIEVADDWLSDFRFQFQVKHLLWATAAVALLVAVAQHHPLSSILLAVLIGVGGMLTFLAWKEKEHEAAVAKRRREQYARRPAAEGAPPDAPSDAPSEVSSEVSSGAQVSQDEKVADAPRPTLVQQLFLFCSPRELLISSITAVVVLALLGIVLGVSVMASCLGFLALLGVVIQAAGADLPRTVVLSWWLTLVLYILLGAILVLTGAS